MQEDLSVATGDHTAMPSSAGELFFLQDTDNGNILAHLCHLLAGPATVLAEAITEPSVP
jgi:hypothetical protein